MRRRPLFLLIPFLLAVAAPARANGGEPPPCVDRSVTAAAVSTRQDVQSFVQCAYEFVQQMGFAEARRAFHEDPRWRSGPTYVFVDEVSAMKEAARAFIFPPDPSREGEPWGPLIDAFGDYYEEVYRLMGQVGVDAAWIYYAFGNPATGRDEPKASFIKRIDWEGNAAVIGAGIYSRDLPGTCEPSEVPRHGTRCGSVQPPAGRVRPLRRPGAGITGILRRPDPVEGSPLAEPLNLPVRIGYLRQHAVQRRSLQPVVRGAGPGAERAPGGSLRGP